MWKQNSQDQLPGWNFFGTQTPLISGVNLWFTEYEQVEGSKEYSVMKGSHANGVYKIKSIVLDYVDVAQKALFKSFANATEQGANLKLQNNIIVHSYSKDIFPLLKNKISPLRAVVVATHSLSAAASYFLESDKCMFLDKAALRIKTHADGWDLILVED